MRIWLCSKKTELLESFTNIAQSMQQDGKSVEGSVEINSGVEFPGQSQEPMVGSAITFEDRDFNNEILVLEIATPHFAYKYEKQARLQIGSCEFCTHRSILRVECKCKRVRYCDEACRQKDEHFHLRNCSAAADNELKQVAIAKRARNTKDGLVGLQNLGNTCYMNSSLQCLSNSYELTKYFLDSKFEFIHELETKNQLGTEGRLVMAYAKLINEMWNMDSQSVAPSLFKRILGEYATQF